MNKPEGETTEFFGAFVPISNWNRDEPNLEDIESNLGLSFYIDPLRKRVFHGAYLSQLRPSSLTTIQQIFPNFIVHRLNPRDFDYEIDDS